VPFEGGTSSLGWRNLYFLWRYNVQKQCLWVSSPGSFGHTFGTEVQGVVVGGLGLATPETSAPHEKRLGASSMLLLGVPSGRIRSCNTRFRNGSPLSDCA
jgi:hypothetical protein